jgi:hypothetical protein
MKRNQIEIENQNEENNKSKKETKLNNIKTNTYDLLSASSISFVLRVNQTKNIILKLIWTIFILGSFGLCAHYFIKNIQKYLEYNVNTSIDTVNENQPEFPTLSFCKTSINSLNFTFDILRLQFNNRNLKDEWMNYFDTYIDPIYGFCYSFNSGKNMFNQSTLIQKVNLARGGLNFEFSLEPYSSNYGEIIIYIHNHSSSFSTFLFGSKISSSCIYNYRVDRVFVQKLPKPYNNCYKDVSLFPLNKTIINYILNKNLIYTHNQCIYYCTSLKYNETINCNCNLESLDDFWSKCLIYSLNKSVNECVNDFIEDFSSSNIFEKCDYYCPLECESLTYSISQEIQPILVSGNLTDDFFYPDFKTADNFSTSFYSINIDYGELKYTLISQSPQIELFGLISNIGGTFSLFLGLSFICLIDILHIFWESIAIILRK